MERLSRIAVCLVVSLCTLSAAPLTAASQQTPEGELMAALERHGDLGTFAGLLSQTGLAETLGGEQSYTVFAPTDAAFAALPEGTLAAMSDEELADLLRRHVVLEAVTVDEAVDLGTLSNVVGDPVAVVRDDDGVTVNGVVVSEPDIAAGTDVVHVIDEVMVAGQEAR